MKRLQLVILTINIFTCALRTTGNMLGQMGQNSRSISMSWRNIVEAFF